MKNIVKSALCAIMMAVCTTAVQAQETPSNEQRMSREQLAEAQAKYIAHELALDDATTQKFIDTFTAYQKEKWALKPRHQRKHQESQTEAEAEQANKQRMEHKRKMLDLREKYYELYSKFLTQKQIERTYELERKAMKRLMKRGPKGKQGSYIKGHPGQRPPKEPRQQ